MERTAVELIWWHNTLAHIIRVENHSNTQMILSNGSVKKVVSILHWNAATGTLVCTIDKQPYRFIRLCEKNCSCWRWYSVTHDAIIALHRQRPARCAAAYNPAQQFTSQLKSPLGGRILQIYVSNETWVKKDEPLLVIESMKMENEIRAPHDAFIKTLSIQLHDVVEAEQLLIVFTKKGPSNGSKSASNE